MAYFKGVEQLDLYRPVACLRCGWDGFVGDCHPVKDGLVKCPWCAAPVETVVPPPPPSIGPVVIARLALLLLVALAALVCFAMTATRAKGAEPARPVVFADDRFNAVTVHSRVFGDLVYFVPNNTIFLPRADLAFVESPALTVTLEERSDGVRHEARYDPRLRVQRRNVPGR